MLHVVLFRPEIAGNTGNVIRLCANTGVNLHLIKPLGYELDDRKLKRAGLDYHEWATMRVHDSWQDFLTAIQPQRIWAFSARATKNAFEMSYQVNDVLLFGQESIGLNEELQVSLDIHQEQLLKLPMKAGRSLNVSNAVAITVYEAWRQLQFCGID
jgi:tRNA (cytidine/uridine-2'-O-)-methyltransferase